ncbi:PH domain-containing protein [Riemerella anatipestifer]|uniref:PH domain-containing protein n=1 Tax=Riemerella anatipestifer TaxID=34085 RepID=A0AAP6HHH8_RIEAN|nr:PH domain-containing protein [Riemerella anatipestifer]
MKIDLLASFSVVQEDDINKATELFSSFFIEGEKVELAYTHARDKVVFTNKRLICYDVQGLTGSKKEFRFFPYSKITSFSVETAGLFDGDSDFKMWVSGVGVFGIKFSKKIDIKKIGVFLSNKII